MFFLDLSKLAFKNEHFLGQVKVIVALTCLSQPVNLNFKALNVAHTSLNLNLLSLHDVAHLIKELSRLLLNLDDLLL